jgi:hypothetical protein
MKSVLPGVCPQSSTHTHSHTHNSLRPDRAHQEIVFFLFAMIAVLVFFTGNQPSANGQIPNPQALRDFIAEQTVSDSLRIRLRDSLAQVYQLPIYDTCCGGKNIVLWTFENGMPVYRTTINAHASHLSKTDRLYPNGIWPLRLTGSHMKIGVWDSNQPEMNHPEYSGRVFYYDNTPLPGQNQEHFTGIVGTIAATGLANHENARGMAYESTIVAYDCENGDIVEMGKEAMNGLTISNHSYIQEGGWPSDKVNPACNTWAGDGSKDLYEDYHFGYYDEDCHKWDELSMLAPHYLIVNGAGNNRFLNTSQICSPQRNWNGQSTNGFDVIASFANAKNCLNVGAIDEQGGTIIQWLQSCVGPTDDGRIKPDLVALGVQVVTTAPQDLYKVEDGTSIATAVTTGSLALVQEFALQERQGWPLMASTLKALALGTATDLGRPGPDYEYGWGLLNTEAAVIALSQGALHVRDSLFLEQNGTIEIPVYWKQSELCSTPLKATICWTDPPATPIPYANLTINDPSPRLINDVDVKIVRMSNQQVFYPWTLSGRSNPTTNAARTGRNVVDNVEQVCIDNPDEGWYTVVISHAPGATLQGGSQVVSLVVTGNSKPIMLSTTQGATELNSQRKVDDDGARWHRVYESDGEIWHSISTNQGSTWAEDKILSRGSGISTHPSIFALPGGSVVTWKDGNRIRFGMVNYNYSYVQPSVEGCQPEHTLVDTAYFKLADYYRPTDVLTPKQDAVPVVAATGYTSDNFPTMGLRHSYSLVVYETENEQGAGLAYLVFGDLELLTYGLINGTGNGFDDPPVTPSIAFNRYKVFENDQPQFRLAWRAGSSIKYSKISISDYDPLTLVNSQPSILRYYDATGAPSVCPYLHEEGDLPVKRDAVISYRFVEGNNRIIEIAILDSADQASPRIQQYGVTAPQNI